MHYLCYCKETTPSSEWSYRTKPHLSMMTQFLIEGKNELLKLVSSSIASLCYRKYQEINWGILRVSGCIRAESATDVSPNGEMITWHPNLNTCEKNNSSNATTCFLLFIRLFPPKQLTLFTINIDALSVNSQMRVFKLKYLNGLCRVGSYALSLKLTQNTLFFFRCSLIYNEPIVHCHMGPKTNRREQNHYHISTKAKAFIKRWKQCSLSLACGCL